LRMLVDKYKPLRMSSTGSGNGIESADEKLKRSVPQVTERPISSWEEAEGSTSRLSEPLLPSKEDHKPYGIRRSKYPRMPRHPSSLPIYLLLQLHPVFDFLLLLFYESKCYQR